MGRLAAFLILAALSTPFQVFAAACCGGGIPVPALILGDENANLSTTLTYSAIDSDVLPSGVWRRRDVTEQSQTFRLDSAHIVADRFQIGGTLPIVRRARGADTAETGLGDVALNGGYEFLPEWDYSEWRPRGVGFLQLVLPTGRSIYESSSIEQLDSRGRGFWAVGTGFTLTKIRGAWDGVLLGDVHRSFGKEAKGTVAGDLQLSPGWGGSLTAGAGRTYRDFRLGASLAWIYEDATAVAGAIESRGYVSRYASAALGLIYAPSRDWSAALSYADQTLFGTPANTPLARSIQVSYQRRWAR